MLVNFEEKSSADEQNKMTEDEGSELEDTKDNTNKLPNTQEPSANQPKTKYQPQPNETSFQNYTGLSIIIGVVSIITILAIAADECRQCFNKVDIHSRSVEEEKGCRKTFWTYGKNQESGYLSEVLTVMNRLGYQHDPNWTDWDLLWAHDYPFRQLYSELSNLRPHQKVNHFPGCGYITNKVDLATSGLKYIPPAFKLPKDKGKLLEYAKSNPNLTFVQKNNDHRNIKVTNIDRIDLNKEGTFIQEYVDKPLLVDGHKFDIGIYTVITSIQPLRVYIYNGEALLRFCPEKYYPFDPEKLDKYVVGDDYLPIWDVPSLDYYYNKLGFGMRDSLNAYLRSKGKDPSVIWEQIEDAIRTVILAKEPLIVDVVKRFKSKRNFFEMMRIDFVIDENLKIYLLEANMSPNLSSAHFRPNRLLYHQVLYNVLGLVGVGEKIFKNTLAFRNKAEQEMVVSDKNIATHPELCNSQLCQSSCASTACHLCKPCMSSETRKDIVTAAWEHFHKGDCKRIFPPSMTQEEARKDVDLEGYSPENQLHYRWFRGKCLLDPSWC